MIEEFSLQTVLTYLTLISVPVGVFYHIMTLRNTQRNQTLQLFNAYLQPRLTENFWDKVLDVTYQEWSDYEDWFTKYGSQSNKEAWLKFQTLAVYFNSLGELTMELNMGVNIVNAAMGPVCEIIWEKIKPLVYAERERYTTQFGTASRYMDSFEELYNQIKKHKTKSVS